MSEEAAPREIRDKARRNWWKIAFYVMLLLFEITREWAVAATYEPPKIGVLAYVGGVGSYVNATGRLRRIDVGAPLSAGAVRISCDKQEGRCQEIMYGISHGYVGAPDSTSYTAKFSDDAVSYENDEPICIRYAVRIDLRLNKVFAVRERKGTTNALCKGVEPRLEMTLADGSEPYRPEYDHLLPIVSLVRFVLGS